MISVSFKEREREKKKWVRGLACVTVKFNCFVSTNASAYACNSCAEANGENGDYEIVYKVTLEMVGRTDGSRTFLFVRNHLSGMMMAIVGSVDRESGVCGWIDRFNSWPRCQWLGKRGGSMIAVGLPWKWPHQEATLQFWFAAAGLHTPMDAIHANEQYFNGNSFQNCSCHAEKVAPSKLISNKTTIKQLVEYISHIISIVVAKKTFLVLFLISFIKPQYQIKR